MKLDAKGLIILLCVVTALATVVLYWQNLQIDREIPPTSVTHEEGPQSLGASIYAEGSNPAANTPDSNPIKDNLVNPFDAYQNPFETQ